MLLSSGMVKYITGGYKIKYHPKGPEGEELEIDFSPPWRRISMMAELERKIGSKLPAADQLHTPGAQKLLDDLAKKHNVECTAPRTVARLLDKVILRSLHFDWLIAWLIDWLIDFLCDFFENVMIAENGRIAQNVTNYSFHFFLFQNLPIFTGDRREMGCFIAGRNEGYYDLRMVSVFCYWKFWIFFYNFIWFEMSSFSCRSYSFVYLNCHSSWLWGEFCVI